LWSRLDVTTKIREVQRTLLSSFLVSVRIEVHILQMWRHGQKWLLFSVSLGIEVMWPEMAATAFAVQHRDK